MLASMPLHFLLAFSLIATGPEAPAAAGPQVVDDGEEDEGEEEGESESEQAVGVTDPTLRYSRDLSDDGLKRRWTEAPESLGSISVGFADQGRMINAVQLQDGEGWICQRPDLAWGARETVDGLTAAFREVGKQFPDGAPARLSHIGHKDGGWLRPHRSHQSGRDADIGFFYKRDVVPHGRVRREKLIDPERNWALLRALLAHADVQVVLVDRRIRKVLHQHALRVGEDPALLERIFRGGPKALVQHARRHRDHFHVRFFAPRSQELGRRIQPLLALRPDQNLVLHRVKNGQTLGHIARAWRTTVAAIMKANRMRRTFLRLGQQLKVPLRGPCTRCPLPPAQEVPPRVFASAAGGAGPAVQVPAGESRR